MDWLKKIYFLIVLLMIFNIIIGTAGRFTMHLIPCTPSPKGEGAGG